MRKKRVFRLLAVSLGLTVGVGIGFFLLTIKKQVAESSGIHVAEPDYETTGYRYLFDRRLGWRNIPNWEATTENRKLKINSRGLRDREYSLQKPPGTKRILVLGDSYVWGYGVSNEEIFTEVLERTLAKSSGSFEVINTGVSGWSTDQEYLFLRSEGIKYSPDIVVLALYLLNDLDNNVHAKQYGLSKPVFLNLDLELGNDPVPEPGTETASQDSSVEPVPLTLRIINAIDELCSSRQCKLVVMKFGRFLRPHHKEVIELERRLEEGMRRLPQIAYFDLDEAFDQLGLTETDLVQGNLDGHWNPVGHWQTAKLLHHFLQSQRMLEPSEN